MRLGGFEKTYHRICAGMLNLQENKAISITFTQKPQRMRVYNQVQTKTLRTLSENKCGAYNSTQKPLRIRIAKN